LIRWLWIIGALVISGCLVQTNPETTERWGVDLNPDTQPSVELKNYGQAPELTNDIWLNTNEPLRLKDLRGKVVLLEMWTFG
jgi:hypothetical protein